MIPDAALSPRFFLSIIAVESVTRRLVCSPQRYTYLRLTGEDEKVIMCRGNAGSLAGPHCVEFRLGLEWSLLMLFFAAHKHGAMHTSSHRQCGHEFSSRRPTRTIMTARLIPIGRRTSTYFSRIELRSYDTGDLPEVYNTEKCSQEEVRQGRDTAKRR